MEIHIPADFTLQELKAFIAGEQLDVADGFYTAREWAEHFGISTQRMRALLRKAKSKGLLEMTRVERTALDGKIYAVPVYAFKEVSDVAKNT